MMLGLGGLRNPLTIGQMMGGTISAEPHDSLYGGLIPSPNHHGGYRRIGVHSVIGFFSRNGDLAPEKRLPRLIGYNRFWRVQHVGNGSGAIHA